MRFRSAGYALSWEYWRRGMYWFIPACSLLTIVCMTPAYLLLQRGSSGAGLSDVRIELCKAVFGLVCWVPLVVAAASRGFVRRPYALPVSTARLAGWTLANGAMAVAITYWLTALEMNVLFRAGWPAWEPAWWAVVFYTACQATMWSTAGNRGAVFLPLVYVGLSFLFGGSSGFLERLVPSLGSAGKLVWPAISVSDFLFSGAVALCFCVAAGYLVARDRRGRAWTLAWLSPRGWLQRASDSAPAPAVPVKFTPRTFRSPQAAQLWMEWRSSGRYVLGNVVLLVGLLWGLAAWHGWNPYTVSSIVTGITGSLIGVSPVIGVYLGHRSDKLDIKSFLATRPLTDAEHARIVLGHAAGVFAASALVWYVAYVVTVAMGRLHWAGPVSELRLLAYPKADDLFFFGSLTWTLVGLGTAVGMARSWFVPVGVGGGLLFIGSTSITAAISPSIRDLTEYLVPIGCLAGTAVAFWAAFRKRHISLRTLLGALAAYAALVAVCFFIEWGHIWSLFGATVNIAGFLAAPLAPLAAAPLALAWNRHR